MTVSELRSLIIADLRRYGKSGRGVDFWRHFLLGVGSKYTIWFRICSYLWSHKFLKYTLGIPCRLILDHYRFKFGIEIMPGTAVGPGLYIGHFGSIIVSGRAKIGKNCNLSQNVTIGAKNSGGHPGVPVIGDNCYIGPGAKVIGGITLGDNSVVGANAVVTKDFPAGSILGGVPAKVIGSSVDLSYVKNTGN